MEKLEEVGLDNNLINNGFKNVQLGNLALINWKEEGLNHLNLYIKNDKCLYITLWRFRNMLVKNERKEWYLLLMFG